MTARSPRNRGRATPVVLTPDEREQLEALARRYTAPYAHVVRAQVILRAADGWQNTDIAAYVHLPRWTVGKWRIRFARERMAGLADRPGRGRHRTHGPAPAAATVQVPAAASGHDAADARPVRRSVSSIRVDEPPPGWRRIRCGRRGCSWRSALYPPTPASDPNPEALAAWAAHAQRCHSLQAASSSVKETAHGRSRR